jgi:hypothetical protein
LRPGDQCTGVTPNHWGSASCDVDAIAVEMGADRDSAAGVDTVAR